MTWLEFFKTFSQQILNHETRFVNRVQDFIFLFISLQFKVLIITMIKNNFDIVKHSEIISEFDF